MKNIWMTGVCLSLIFVFSVFPGSAEAGSGQKIGDPELDQTIGEIDRAARHGLGDYAKKMGRKFDMPPEMVDWMLNKAGLSPGDSYMAAKVAQVANRPVGEVVDAYQKNRGKGWGAIAKKMGIKPGSAEFHALKAGGSDFAGPGKNQGKGKGKAKKKRKGKGEKW